MHKYNIHNNFIHICYNYNNVHTALKPQIVKLIVNFMQYSKYKDHMHTNQHNNNIITQFKQCTKQITCKFMIDLYTYIPMYAKKVVVYILFLSSSFQNA